MPDVSRRTALKAGLACAACAALPRVVRAALEPTPVLGRFVIRISQHAELANVNGSKVFAVPGVTTDAGEIVVTRQAGNAFSALSAICTHEGCQVSPYDPSIQRIPCVCHGSRFRLDGSVAAGPAQRALPRYSATFDAGMNAVFVDIPGFVGAEAEAEADGLGLRLTAAHPVREVAHLQYTMPVTAAVRLAVYDAAGREMAVLVDAVQAAGTYPTLWNAREAPAGVYVLRLSAGVQQRTLTVTVMH